MSRRSGLSRYWTIVTVLITGISSNPRIPPVFLEYLDHPVMKKSVLCTTIETNRFYPDIMRNAPVPQERAAAMQDIANYGIPTYVTCEPLMKFDLGGVVKQVRMYSPHRRILVSLCLKICS
ncbi:hypothetical protein [Bacteroides thetaiotaomicron]|uniref:hypothetical protein n=1 Tax=Bacteroides thetaiotaomicron TaxID=818 RepID=UPI0032C154C5